MEWIGEHPPLASSRESETPQAAAPASSGVASLSDLDMWAAHMVELNDHMHRVHQTYAQEEAQMKQAFMQDRAKLLAQLRCGKLDSVLAAMTGWAESRLLSSLLRRWAVVSHQLLRERWEQRSERSRLLQSRLSDKGRTDLLGERLALQQQASDAAMQAEALRSSLSQYSHELERTMVRDASTFEMWTAEANQTKGMVQKLKNERAHEREAAQAKHTRLLEEVEQLRQSSSKREEEVQVVVTAVLWEELSHAEALLRSLLLHKAVSVRLHSQEARLYRSWRLWSSLASLALRDTCSSLREVEMLRQQERRAHVRLQAVQGAEVAQLRVENLEARMLLHKADMLGQLLSPHHRHSTKANAENPRVQLSEVRGMILPTASKELAAQCRSLQAEISHFEEQMASVREEASSELARREEEHSQAVIELENRLIHERGSSAFHAEEQLRSAEDLQRAGCEMRVLTKSAAFQNIHLLAFTDQPTSTHPEDDFTLVAKLGVLLL
ncbi:MAG: hypothetical protein SGPRY_005492 [Prymnesium sp.]